MQVSARIKDIAPNTRGGWPFCISPLQMLGTFSNCCAQTKNTPMEFSDFMRGKQIKVSDLVIFLWKCSTLRSKYIW